MFMNTRSEVLYLMAHLIITLVLIALYGVLTAMGHQDETLRNLLLLIGGYWFGAMSGSSIKQTMKKKEESKHE